MTVFVSAVCMLCVCVRRVEPQKLLFGGAKVVVPLTKLVCCRSQSLSELWAKQERSSRYQEQLLWPNQTYRFWTSTLFLCVVELLFPFFCSTCAALGCLAGTTFLKVPSGQKRWQYLAIPVRVPTSRFDLAKWLSSHRTTDNTQTNPVTVRLSMISSHSICGHVLQHSWSRRIATGSLKRACKTCTSVLLLPVLHNNWETGDEKQWKIHTHENGSNAKLQQYIYATNKGRCLWSAAFVPDPWEGARSLQFSSIPWRWLLVPKSTKNMPDGIGGDLNISANGAWANVYITCCCLVGWLWFIVNTSLLPTTFSYICTKMKQSPYEQIQQWQYPARSSNI